MVIAIVVFCILIIIGIILVSNNASSKKQQTSPLEMGILTDTPDSPEDQRDKRVSDLLKQASAYSVEGSWDDAIDTVKKAYSEIAQGRTGYSIGIYLRLPSYLHKAGKRDEAWKELNRLLMKYSDNIYLEKSSIYNKMKGLLQQENKFNLAIRFGIFAFISKAIDLSLQHRTREICRSKDDISQMLHPLLKKAKKEYLSNKLIDLIHPVMKNPPTIQLHEISKQIDEILKSG